MPRTLPIYLVIILYVFALTQPAFSTGKSEPYYGILALLTGWLGVGWGGIGSWSWLANPLFMVSVFLAFRKKKWSIRLAIAAALLAASFLLAREMPVDEAGHFGDITARQTGYWSWLSAMIALVVATYVSYPGDTKRKF